jgi:hypothetical protein
MPRFKVAHVKEQGVNLIIVPLDDAFDRQPSSVQQQTVAQLQARASAAGLAGTVVPVWQSVRGMSFIAPRNWHAFFKSLSFSSILGNVNKELSW